MNLFPEGRIRDVAEKHCDEILFELGLKEDSPIYDMQHYGLLFKLFHAISDVQHSIEHLSKTE